MTKATAHHGFIESTYIPVNKLGIVWQQAQRELRESHVQNIINNFDPEKFGTIAVAKPNGHGIHHIIDGNHRKVVVERMWGDKEQVPCQVYQCDNAARAAELFDEINTNRKAPSAVQIFRVRVTAKYDLETSINKVVNSCGYHVGGSGSKKDMSCIGALKTVYSSYGADILRETLNLITAIWGGEDKQATDGTMVRGIGDFLAEYRGIDFKRLRDVMGNKYTPARLYGGAKSYKEIHGGSLATAIKAIFVNTYNHGLRESKHLKRKGHDGE